MNSNKIIYGLSIGIIVALLIVAIVFIILDVKKSKKHHHPPQPAPSPHPQPYPNNIGGETDKHGCYTSAGYQWSKKEKRCVRPWLENLNSGPIIVGGITNNGCIPGQRKCHNKCVPWHIPCDS